MEWIVNSEDENWQNILFVYDERNWEITLDKGLSDREVNLFVLKRVDELTDEFLAHNSYDLSDLIVDYRKKEELDGNQNY
jgi:hypothetical protein